MLNQKLCNNKTKKEEKKKEKKTKGTMLYGCRPRDTRTLSQLCLMGWREPPAPAARPGQKAGCQQDQRRRGKLGLPVCTNVLTGTLPEDLLI